MKNAKLSWKHLSKINLFSHKLFARVDEVHRSRITNAWVTWFKMSILFSYCTVYDITYNITVIIMHTHTHPFNSPFSGTTRVSRYQKGETNLDCTEARDSEWQWHQLGHMQACTSHQTNNQASTPPLSFYRWMPFLPPNQQRQSTEGML